MKTTMAAGALGLALLSGAAFSGAAWAQSEAPPPPPPASDAAPGDADAMPPPPPPGGEMREGRNPGDGMGPRGGRGRHGDRGPRGWRNGPPPPPPSKAAEFRFRRGPLDIRVRCAEDEPIKACADAALVLMDKFATVAGPTPPPPGAGAPPPAGAQPPPPAPAQ